MIKLKVLERIIYVLIFLAVKDDVSGSADIDIKKEDIIAPIILKDKTRDGPNSIPYK